MTQYQSETWRRVANATRLDLAYQSERAMQRGEYATGEWLKQEADELHRALIKHARGEARGTV